MFIVSATPLSQLLIVFAMPFGVVISLIYGAEGVSALWHVRSRPKKPR